MGPIPEKKLGMKQVVDETACVRKSRWSELQICCAGEAGPSCQDPWHLHFILQSAWIQPGLRLPAKSPGYLQSLPQEGRPSKDSHGSLWLLEVTSSRGRKSLLRGRKRKEGCCSAGPHDSLPAQSAESEQSQIWRCPVDQTTLRADIT